MSTFTQSETIGELITALAKAQLEFTHAVKDSENPAFRNAKYADLASNINAVRPALNKNGIAIIQADSSDLTTGKAVVRTSLHLGEQWIATEADAPAIGMKGELNVQTLGSAWTYLRRYTLQAICGLASEDDDGNSLSNGMVDAKKPAQIAAEEKRDKIDPPTPINNFDAQAKASLKLEAEKKAAAMRAELAEKQGNFSLDNGVLTCKIIGIQKKQKKDGKDYYSVTFNGRLSNGAGYASCFDTALWEVLDSCLDKECKLAIEVKGAYANIKDVVWFEGIPEPITNDDLPHEMFK